jgi:hypothetical protein
MNQGTVADFFESRDAITAFLFVNDPPAPVDLCFVLGCPTPTNMDPAIALYHRGFTRRILISGHGPSAQAIPEAEQFKTYAIARGVPENAMLLETAATNTRENFTLSSPIIAGRYGWQNIQSVAIVCKPFHARRAIMTARAHWPAHVKLQSRPSEAPDDPPATTWWQTEAGRNYVLRELQAIGTYALQGDLGGF